MPKPEKGESKEHYISRCIPIVINEGTAKNPKQANAICHSMWEQHLKKKESENDFERYEPPEAGDAPKAVKDILQSAYSSCRSRWKQDYPSDTLEKNKTRCSKIAWAAVHNAGWFKDSDGKWKKKSEHESEIKMYNFECDLKEFSLISTYDVKKTVTADVKEDDNWVTFKAVAVIGNRIMKRVYVPYDELKKHISSWNGTYHDINHMGTSYPDTTFPFKRQNIEYIIGYQTNAAANDATKEISVDVVVNKNSPKYNIWKSFVDIATKAGRIPNVSMSILARSKKVRIRDLNMSLSDYGFNDNDFIEYLYDIQPIALTTCIEGECNDAKGCGLLIQSEKDCNDNQCDCKTDGVAISDEDAKKIAYYVERIKKLKGVEK